MNEMPGIDKVKDDKTTCIIHHTAPINVQESETILLDMSREDAFK